MNTSSAPSEHSPDSIHLPAPSYWPIALAFAMAILPVGLLLAMWGGSEASSLLVLGGLATIICLTGWANILVRETATLPNLMEDDRWMRMGILLFLISESAIFGALFAHHFYARWHAPVWPPAGAPKLSTQLPAIATLILMASSATVQQAHSAIVRGRRKAADRWLALTILMGVIFLAFQGYDWGFLKTYDHFTQTSGAFGSSFYAMTGFHGLHVLGGLIMLSVVWFRLRLGHFDPQRHFSLAAASWYWHFVDLIWVFLFFTIYLF
jgi:cytochrome c oxidase subunit 3